MQNYFVLTLVFLLALGASGKNIRISGAKGNTFHNAILSGKQLTTIEAETNDDILTVNKKIPKGLLTEGDIYGGKNQRNAITNKNYFWPSTTVPIAFDPALNLIAIAGIEDARQEYEMRTCFSFPTKQSSDEDYLLISPLDGCWSYVGIQGGEQTVSIGSGCESMSTVIHELLHAIGLYHEQSRTDRDGYVTIETQNIDPEYVYAFDKYSYGLVDDRRVPYDYNSVMHYGDTAFSNNGEKTILTRDPQFQNMIGQRRTFSEGDVTKVNRMYDCAEPVRVSTVCNFEESNVCGYVQESENDNIDWIRYVVGETDGSDISSNIPLSDRTFGESNEGTFMIVDTSNHVSGYVAEMISMRLKSNQPQQCLEFSYFMDLEVGSDASLTVLLAEVSDEDGAVLSTSELITISGDSENYWNTERFTIQASSNYKLLFKAITSGSQSDVIAIDDISILDKPCESSYFIVHDYSSLLELSQKGDSFWGPLLYNEEGYAFKILIYPQGTTSADDGYMSMFFALARGVNDDNLQWPFENQVLRMSVVDQDANALTRMNNYLSFMTDDASYWDKPTSDLNSALGYTNFMSLKDITSSRNFVKNDALYISINTRNMNSYQRKHPEAFISAHPAEPVVRESYDHDPHHDDDHNDNEHHFETNVEININKPHPEKDQTESVSPSMVGGIAFACAVVVFLLMSVVILCINQSHKQAMTAITIANHNSRINAKEGHFSNMTYQQEKI